MFTKLYLCAYVIMGLEYINMVIAISVVDFNHSYEI